MNAINFSATHNEWGIHNKTQEQKDTHLVVNRIRRS